MLESMQQLLGEVRNSEAAKKETATRLTAEIEAASRRLAAGPGWTPDQEVRRWSRQDTTGSEASRTAPMIHSLHFGSPSRHMECM